jgi:hypothetical protein
MSGSSEYEAYLNSKLHHPTNAQMDWIPYKEYPTKPETLLWASDNEKYIFESVLNKNWDEIFEFLLNYGIEYSHLMNAKYNIESTIQYYIQNPITYKLNTYQLRSDEFSLNEIGNVFLGCSDTFGVGQSWEHTWPYILSKIAFPDDKIYNLGVPGSGSDTAFRILNHLKDKIKIKNIFHWLPVRHRYEIYLGNDKKDPSIGSIIIDSNGTKSDYISGYTQVTPQTEIDNGLFSNEYIMNSMSTDTSLSITDLKNILAIKSIANTLGINYYVGNFNININGYDNSVQSDVYEYFKSNNIPYKLEARDLQHMKIYDNAKVITNFLTAVKKTNKNII